MSFRMNLWCVKDGELDAVESKALDAEARLESWLSADPALLGLDVLLVGRQVVTAYGGRIDLLGLDRDANCVILELKRGRTPRDIVAQLLDYGSWIEDLGFEEINTLCQKFCGKGVSEAFSECFEESLPDTVNSEHRLVLVASELDDSSERIIEYLSKTHGLGINAVFFSYFSTPAGEFVGRAWLRDPEEVEERAGSRKRSPWTGYWFVNTGDGEHRSWDDNMRYGFISAGQGVKYSRPLKKLTPGSTIFAYRNGLGYVGYGKVESEAVPITEFVPKGHKKPLLDLELEAADPGNNAGNLELCEWVVPINWKKTFPREEAQSFKGVFANQNIVCKLRHSATVEFLEKQFGVGEG